MRRLDLAGEKFGKLEVVSFVTVDKHGNSVWLCKCQCGIEKPVAANNLRSKSSKTVSCGCAKSEISRDAATTHGFSHSPTYESWNKMRQRCNNPNFIEYKNYGYRGIKVCLRWNKFENFLEDMGERPEGKSIDRKDSKGNYEKDNCKWSTAKEQQNNRGNNHLVTYLNKTQTVSQWADELGWKRHTLDNRLRAGWSLDRVFKK